MERREFITLLGGIVATWPLIARAQPAEHVQRRIGMLVGSADNPEGHSRVDAFRQALAALGWTEGRDLRIDLRWGAANTELTKTFAKEVVDLSPELILAETTPVVAALLRESRSIPLVFVNVSDPVGSGFVASLARPGGLITGFISNEASLAAKWLELLRETAPEIKRAALLFNPQTATYVGPFWNTFEVAASSFGIQAIAARVHDVTELESTVADLAGMPNSGLVIMAEIFATVHQKRIIELATEHRLPTVYPFDFFARNGGLMSYGVDIDDLFRRAASYVDRILKGEKPADLPVQAPTKFQLIVNLKTARTLSFTVPTKLLSIADEVIE
jgi:putative tryptophan/tyrosine transport system substrate-binding protein